MANKPSRPKRGPPPEGTVRASSVRIHARTWLWEPLLPQGAFCVVGGRSGSKKTTVMVDLSAQVSRGALEPGDLYGKPKGVAYIGREDSFGVGLVPSLMAAEADLGRIILPNDKDFSLPGDIAKLTAWIKEEDLGLVVLDPLLRYVNTKHSLQGNYHGAQHALGPIADLAAATGCTIVGITHVVKRSVQAEIESFIGSTGITSTARLNLVCGQLSDDESVLGVLQSNVGGNERMGRVFTTRPVDLAYDRSVKRWITPQAVTWTRLAKKHEVAQALTRTDDPAADAALIVLLSLLADGQPHPMEEVLDQLMTQLGRRRRTAYSVVHRAVPLHAVRTQKGRGGSLKSWLTVTPLGRSALSDQEDDEDLTDEVDEVIARLPDGTDYRPPEE